jgi:hypothetical protein
MNYFYCIDVAMMVHRYKFVTLPTTMLMFPHQLNKGRYDEVSTLCINDLEYYFLAVYCHPYSFFCLSIFYSV